MRLLEKIVVRTMIAFSVFVLIISVIGTVCASELDEISTLSTLFSTSKSIRYTTLFQGLLVTFVVSLLNIGLDQSSLYKGMLFPWKNLLRVISSVGITIFCVLIFGWFPIDNISAWIGFIISFACCMSGAVAIMCYKTKKENEEYQILFEKYKKQHQGEEQKYENH